VVAQRAYATCLRIAREHYENFPVASRLLPRDARPHIAAIYAFARAADDFADEGDDPSHVRIARLDDWGERLRLAAAGRIADDGSEPSQIFAALSETMARCRLEPSLFEDLLSAFRQDVLVSRYDTWADLLDYCRRSANPIGRLVLRVSGYRSAELDRWADAVCTALQLTNFWQDLERDWNKGRVYLPRDLLHAHGASEVDLERRTWSPNWERSLREAGRRTHGLFAQGRPVADAVHGRLRWELRATWLGGVRVLEKLDAVGYNVFGGRPRLATTDAPALIWRMLRWDR
jgi:phytoene synthase